MKSLLQAFALCTLAASGWAQADDDGADGEATYSQYCFACHSTGVGPMAHDQAVWLPRLEARGSLDGLLASAKQGVNAMPPMGTCMDCSDEQLRATIEFMLKAK